MKAGTPNVENLQTLFCNLREFLIPRGHLSFPAKTDKKGAILPPMNYFETILNEGSFMGIPGTKRDCSFT